MGLIDFIKNVGANLFGKGEDEVTTITNLLNTELPNQITNLQVKFDDGVVDLYGQAESQAAKDTGFGQQPQHGGIRPPRGS